MRYAHHPKHSDRFFFEFPFQGGIWCKGEYSLDNGNIMLLEVETFKDGKQVYFDDDYFRNIFFEGQWYGDILKYENELYEFMNQHYPFESNDPNFDER